MLRRRAGGDSVKSREEGWGTSKRDKSIIQRGEDYRGRGGEGQRWPSVLVLHRRPLRARIDQVMALRAHHAQRGGNVPLRREERVVRHVLAGGVGEAALADAAKVALAGEQPVQIVVWLGPAKTGPGAGLGGVRHTAAALQATRFPPPPHPPTGAGAAAAALRQARRRSVAQRGAAWRMAQRDAALHQLGRHVLTRGGAQCARWGGTLGRAASKVGGGGAA